MSSRKRTVILDDDEDIVSFEHHLYARFIRVLVGFGVRAEDGTFILSQNQNYEQVLIQGQDYEDFISKKPDGDFKKVELWEVVDLARDIVIAQRDAAVEAAPVELPAAPKK